MLNCLWVIPALPLGGFLVLALLGGRMSRRLTAVIGAGSVGLSAVAALLVAGSFWGGAPPGRAYTQTLWVWLNTDGFSPAIALYLDALSMVMMLVVTWRRLSHPPVLHRIHDRRGRLQPVFRLHEPLRGRHADPGAGRQSALALPWLGRRRPLQLSADRLLVCKIPKTAMRPARPSWSPGSATRPWPLVCFCSSPTWARCRFRI